MIKQKTLIEVKIDEKCFEFYCDTDSPIGMVHDAIHQMLAIVVQKINECNKVPEKKEEPIQE